MENRRKDSKVLSVTILLVLICAFTMILGSLVLINEIKPEVITLVGGFGTTMLAMMGMVVSYEFGSSKGNSDKDAAMRSMSAAAESSAAAAPAVVVAKTEPAVEKGN